MEGRDDVSEAKPSHKTQCLAALASAGGMFAVGCILGYSSPVTHQLELPRENATNPAADCGGELSLTLKEGEISLFSSTLNMGAMIGSPIAGVLIRNFGRKTTMLGSTIPFFLGWLLIGLANSFGILVAGRVVCGMCCGFLSLIVPTYIGEISTPDIRGLLASGSQLMTTVGLLYVYSVGAGVCWQRLALASLLPVAIFGASIFFCPESPAYLVKARKYEEATNTLVNLRGEECNIEPELERLKTAAEEESRYEGSIRDLAKLHVLKPFVICMALMFFQQTSGAVVLLFNLDSIFRSAQTNISSSLSSILVAVVQVVSTAVASVLMDRAGRKLLLMVSSGAMCISLVAMGTYFHLEEKQDPFVDSIRWLPVVSLMVFFFFFSIGYGPIPWVMMGELFAMGVKERASGIVTSFNFAMGFFVTLSFQSTQDVMGEDGVYWFYAGICAINFLFCVFVVKETKGKTIEEITAMFGGPTSTAVTKDEFAQTNKTFEPNENTAAN